MGVRIHIKTTDELIGKIEELAQEARNNIGKTRTKLESNEMKGQVMAYNEVIFYIKEYVKTQKEMTDGTGDEVESLDSVASARAANSVPASAK